MAFWRSNPEYKWDLMISYSWAQQALVLKLKEKLEEKGFSIWFDTEQMAKYKSMPAAMGDGIANSVAIIMCISPEYEKSGRCEQEAEFVSQKNKPRFIIKVAKNYHPKTKWLQFLMGDRLYFEMETQKKLETKFDQLEIAICRVVSPKTDLSPKPSRKQRKSVPNIRKFCKTSNSNENLHFARGLFGRKTISLTGSLSELAVQTFNHDSSQFEDKKEEAEEEERNEIVENEWQHSPVEQFHTFAKVLNKIYSVRDIFQPVDETSATRLNLIVGLGKNSTTVPKKMSTDGNFDKTDYSTGVKFSHPNSRSLGEIDLIGSSNVTKPTLLLPSLASGESSNIKRRLPTLKNLGSKSTRHHLEGQFSQFFGSSSTGHLLDL